MKINKVTNMTAQTCGICAAEISGLAGLSRKDNKTLLCTECETEEALDEYGGNIPTKSNDKQQDITELKPKIEFMLGLALGDFNNFMDAAKKVETFAQPFINHETDKINHDELEVLKTSRDDAKKAYIITANHLFRFIKQVSDTGYKIEVNFHERTK